MPAESGGYTKLLLAVLLHFMSLSVGESFFLQSVMNKTVQQDSGRENKKFAAAATVTWLIMMGDIWLFARHSVHSSEAFALKILFSAVLTLGVALMLPVGLKIKRQKYQTVFFGIVITGMSVLLFVSKFFK